MLVSPPKIAVTPATTATRATLIMGNFDQEEDLKMSTNSRPPNRRRPIEPIKQSPPERRRGDRPAATRNVRLRRNQTERTPKGEMKMLRLRNSLDTRTCPKAGCSMANAATAIAVASSTRLLGWASHRVLPHQGQSPADQRHLHNHNLVAYVIRSNIFFK
jgi:hypothetical protein